MTDPWQRDAAPRWLSWIIFSILLAFYGYVKFAHHELWKDEWQAWLMARDMGWAELFGALYYEGHPALWYVYLKLWSLPGWPDVLTLQIAHAIPVALAFGVLFFRWSGPWWLKVLILLSYYPFFEYGLVNRGYALLMLLLFLATGWLKQARGRPWLLAGTFFLLCQTEVYGVLIAGALLFYLFLQEGKWALLKKSWFQKVAGGALAGLIFFVITVFPRASQNELATAYQSAPLSGEVMAKAFQGTLANTYWLGSIPDTNVAGVSLEGMLLSVLLLGLLVWFFWPVKAVRWTFLFFLVSFWLFAATIYTGGVRQWGSAVLFFFALWQLTGRAQPRFGLDRWLILASVLAFQVYYTGRGLEKELKYPFSNAVLAGDFIRKKVPETVPIVAINKFEAAPVSGYAGRPFYALPEGEPFTYFKWVEKIYLPPEAELKLFAEYKGVKGLVVLSPRPLDGKRYPGLQLWTSFTEYNIKNENYYFYILK